MQTNLNLRIGLLTLSMLVIFNSCQPSTKLSRKSIAPYSTQMEANVKFRVFHKTESTQFFIQNYAQHYHVTLRAYLDFKSKDIIYETSKDIKEHPNTIQIIDLPIKRSTYALELTVVNQQDQSIFTDVIAVNKMIVNEQKILVQDIDNNPLLSTQIEQNEVVQFSTGDQISPTFYIKYFKDNFKAALPPFARGSTVFNLRKKSKTTYIVKSGAPFILEKEGLYIVQTDSLSKEGLFINCVESDFPKITRLTELANSLRYITKKEEYQRIANRNLDTKVELDKFWLSRAGNRDKARLLIRLYYNRIQLANQYFSTYKKGWKTDRGIIYTIFGKPTRVQKSSTSEYWFYRRTIDREMVEFHFDKKSSQYILRRSPMLELPWRSEIYEWRRGNALK